MRRIEPRYLSIEDKEKSGRTRYTLHSCKHKYTTRLTSAFSKLSCFSFFLFKESSRTISVSVPSYIARRCPTYDIRCYLKQCFCNNFFLYLLLSPSIFYYTPTSVANELSRQVTSVVVRIAILPTHQLSHRRSDGDHEACPREKRKIYSL